MSVNVYSQQIANYNNPINIYNLSNNEIEEQTKQFRTRLNIGKYIIFIDENTDNGGYGQIDTTDPYKGKQIINESGDRNNPYINLSQEYVDVYILQRPPRGGQSKKKLSSRRCGSNHSRSRRRGRKHIHSRSRTRSNRQIKKNYKDFLYGLGVYKNRHLKCKKA